MKEKYNDATPSRPNGDRAIDASIISFDLKKEIREIKKEGVWKKNDRNAITLLKTESMRIVLIAMHKDALMREHVSKGMISLQVLEGTITFMTQNSEDDLEKGEMITLHEEIPHSVYALTDAVFLLTMAIK